ncbi:MAG: hypothetical protein AAGA28_15550 [Pseudomonadota bacterium]
MSTLAASPGPTTGHPLRLAFLKWQCHTRQLSMRNSNGRPDDAIMPDVTPEGAERPIGAIITVLNKAPMFSVTPELEHIAARTNDPAQRREAALQFLSATYYQKAKEFSDTLTATFTPRSEGARSLAEAGRALLVFECYGQRFDLQCRVTRLPHDNLLSRATMAHNILFNPTLPPSTEVLGFEPDWVNSTADPPLGRR